jgi:hypothetical protein
VQLLLLMHNCSLCSLNRTLTRVVHVRYCNVELQLVNAAPANWAVAAAINSMHSKKILHDMAWLLQSIAALVDLKRYDQLLRYMCKISKKVNAYDSNLCVHIVSTAAMLNSALHQCC